MNPTGQPPQGQQAAQMLAAIMQLMGQKRRFRSASGGTKGLVYTPQLASYTLLIRYNPDWSSRMLEYRQPFTHAFFYIRY